MGATKNLQSIRQKYGVEREVQRRAQNNVEQQANVESRSVGPAKATLHFDTEPLIDAR